RRYPDTSADRTRAFPRQQESAAPALVACCRSSGVRSLLLSLCRKCRPAWYARPATEASGPAPALLADSSSSHDAPRVTPRKPQRLSIERRAGRGYLEASSYSSRETAANIEKAVDR